MASGLSGTNAVRLWVRMQGGLLGDPAREKIAVLRGVGCSQN